MPGLTLIADWVAAGQEFGIFDFYLPFVITFAIFWALLTKVKLFGDPYPDTPTKQTRVIRSVNLIVASGASLYIMANTGMGVSFAMFLSGLFGGTFMVIMTIIAFVSVVYIAAAIAKGGGDPFEAKLGDRKIWMFVAMLTVIAAVLFALGVYISSSGAALFPGFVLPGFEVPSIPTVIFPSIDLTSQDLAIIVMVAVTILIIFYVTREGSGGGGDGKNKKNQ